MKVVLGLCVLLMAVRVAMPHYWDIFPYLYWYYRYYHPNLHTTEYRDTNARLVDGRGGLRIQADDHYSTVYNQPPPNQCYQCTEDIKEAYVYEVIKVPIVRNYRYAPKNRRSKTIYVSKLVRSRDRVKGWGSCHNAFPHNLAGVSDITTVPCTNPCFTRVNNDNVVSRGCLSDDGLHLQAGDGCYQEGAITTCVCTGGRCNNKDAPLGPPK